MSDDELKPCPFCGATAKLFSHDMDGNKTLWWVQCTNSHCIARRQVTDDMNRAVDAWNSRWTS